MTNHIGKKTISFLAVAGIACGMSCAEAAPPTGACKTKISVPVLDETPPVNAANRTVVLSGGCFWGIQAVFQHIKGVKKAVSGYTGGSADTAHYNLITMGNTGHAESVEVTYDPAQVTVGKLLRVFFSVAHDPTTLNRQGPDTGTHYRSAIFFTTAEQEKIAKAYISQMENEQSFSGPIVTEVTPLEKFYPAENYHQDYARNNPNNPYIVTHDLPKVADLKREFPDLYIER